MAKGLPKWAIREAKKRGAKNIFAYAWSLVKRKKGKRRKSSRTRTSNPRKRRSVRKTAKKRRKRGSNLQATIFKWLRVGALVAPGAIAFTQGNTWEEKFSYVMAKYTGYESWNNRFNPMQLAEGWTPFLMTTLVTSLIPKISGIIRRL